MRANRAVLAVVAAGAATLTSLTPITAHAAARDGELTLSAKRFCADNGATRVRMSVENTTQDSYQLGWEARFSTDRVRHQFLDVPQKVSRTAFITLTVPADGTVKFTVGEGGDDFAGLWSRKFTPRDC